MESIDNPEVVVDTVEITNQVVITRNEIEGIIVNGIEGGIRYWCYHIEENLKDGTYIREGKPKETPLSVWVTKLVLDGKEVGFFDGEETKYLSLENLVSSFKHHITNGRADLEDYDSEDADYIIQRALYGSVVFG